MASISDLKDITVEGGYFATKRTFPILANKINVVFGRNGSGKSSLSRAVLQYKNGKGCEFSDVHFNVELDDDVKNHIYVFNESFVREQMQVAPDGTRRDKLGTIVMYGRQIADSGELERARAEYEAKKSERDRMSAEKERLTLRQEELENSILKSLKKDGAYSSLLLEYLRIENPDRKNKPTVTVDAIKKICSARPWNGMPLDCAGLLSYINRKIEELKNSARADLIEWTRPEVNEGLDSEYINELLRKEVVSGNLSEADKKLISSLQAAGFSLNRFADEARSVFSGYRIHTCPLCRHELTDTEIDDLFKSIERQFDHRAKEYKDELLAAMSSIRHYEIVLPVLPDNFKERVDAFYAAQTLLNAERDKVVSMLEAKTHSLEFASRGIVDSERLRLAVSKCEDSLKLLEEDVRRHNELVAQVKEEMSKLSTCIEYYSYVTNKADIDEYLGLPPRIKAIDITAIDYELGRMSRNIDELKSRSSRKNNRLAMDAINEGLEMIFGNPDRIHLEEGDMGYRLSVRGNANVRPDQVSTGERNILALAYFFASVLQGVEEGKEDLQDALIFIDDPVSSYDADNRVGTLSFLKWKLFSLLISRRAKRKIVVFSHELGTVMDLARLIRTLPDNIRPEDERLMYYEITRDSVNIVTVNTMMTEYQRLIGLVYEFAKTGNPDLELVVGNAMRRVAEAYSSFNYNIGFKEMLTDGRIFGKLPKPLYNKVKNRMVGLLFDNESHSREDVAVLSLNTSRFSPEDLRQAAQYLLAFLFRINEQHIDRYLRDACYTISRWAEEFSTD